MRKKQNKPHHIRKKNRQYSPTSLTNAYKMVKESKMSVRKAAAICRVPESTLRDRTLGLVHPDTLAAGSVPLFDHLEEALLVKHFKKMADYGYGYTRQECVDIATDYAIQLGKRKKDQPLSIKWFRGFIRRWPELKVLKPRALEHSRAKMASKEVVNNYFQNLKETMEKHELIDKPHLIFNIDEKGISVDHRPPFVVAGSNYCPPAVTTGKGQTTTVLGCGSAAGQCIPPFFVFAGQRMRPELLDGASHGADGTVSESGWSNGAIFRHYIEQHFLKYVPGRNGQKLLLIVDGHKSHVSVGLAEWALERDIILFILPPHCSHILQPMDLGCFGPFQRIYNGQCHKLMRETSAVITRYNICEVACRAYTKALSIENIQSAFRRAGIFPLNSDAIPAHLLLPAEVFQIQESDDADSQATVEGGVTISETEAACDMLYEKEKKLKKIKCENKSKPRNTMSKLVAGKEISKEVVEKMKVHVNKQKQTDSSKVKKDDKKVSINKAKSDVLPVVTSPKPGPSHYNLISDSSEEDIDAFDESELCCQCKKYTPDAVYRSISIIFVKWGQCDNIIRGRRCNHWVRLSYCSPVKVLRRGDNFYCPCCQKEE